MRLVFTAVGVTSCLVVGCAADTFVGADGGSGDSGGPPAVMIACASSTICTAGQACCVALTNGWSQASCQPDTAEGKLGCERYLSCSDAADCPTGHACCATTATDASGQVIVSTQCLSACSGANQVQLCNKAAPNECLTGTCNDWNGNPSWVMTCQQ